MLYGFIYHFSEGIELHIVGYEYIKYIGFSLKQAKQLYRKTNNLKYKRITWI